MMLAWGLLSVALSQQAAKAEPPISYEVVIVDVGGVEWRERVIERLRPVTRQGAAEVWTTDRAGLRLLIEPLENDPEAHIVAGPKTTAMPGAKAQIVHETRRNYVARLERIADGPVGQATQVAFKPDVQALPDGLRISLSGQPVDQGLLVHAKIDENRFLAFHHVMHRDAVKGVDGRGPSPINAQYQVPEVVRTTAEGEWLVPHDEALVVSLGARHLDTGRRSSTLRERLVVIRCSPVRRVAGAVGPQAIQRAAFQATVVPPPLVLPAPTPDASIGDGRLHSMTVHSSGPIAVRPMPAMPSRALPVRVNPDGTIAPLPPLPDPALRPASHDDSAEPRPSPQAPHVGPAGVVPASGDAETIDFLPLSGPENAAEEETIFQFAPRSGDVDSSGARRSFRLPLGGSFGIEVRLTGANKPAGDREVAAPSAARREAGESRAR